MFEDRAKHGYARGRHLMVFYRGLALHPRYVDGFIEGHLNRVAQTRPEGGQDLAAVPGRPRALRGHVLDVLKSECDVRAGRPT